MPSFCQLNDHQIRHAQAASQTLWGTRRSLDTRLAMLKEHMTVPGSPLTYWGLVSDRGDLLSSCKVYSCLLSFHGRLTRALGIGAVFTEDHLRSNGYAQQLVDAVGAMAQSQSLESVYLWSDIGAPFYARLGYQPFPRRRCRLHLEQIDRTLAGLLESRAVTPADKPFLLDLYNERISTLEIGTARDDVSWDIFRAINGPPIDHVVFNGSGKPLGYFSCSVESDCLWVEEAIAVPGWEMHLRAQLAHFAEINARWELHYWQQPFGVLAETTAAEDVAKPLPMIRFFDPAAASYHRPNRLTFFGGNDHF